MATRRTTKVEIGLAAAGAQSTQQANEAREPVAAVDSNGKPAFDNGKSGKKPQQQKSRFLALFLGALLLSFNVAAVMLMDLSKDQDGKYPFNTASAVVCAEFSKFIIASIGFSKALRTNPNVKYSMHWSGFLKYSIPGLLYAFCNVGNFEVLKYLSSSLYQVFNNMKIITTAVVFRMFLKRELTVIQWVCLVFLTLGMVVTAPKEGLGGDGGEGSSASAMVTGITLMVFMSCASAMAGVYNEFLLKGSEDDAFFQSMQLYFWGVVICMVQFFHSAPEDQAFFHGYTVRTWGIIFLNAMYGQVVALVFKYADNIVKVYANSLASLVTAFLTYLIFGTQLTSDQIIGSMLVCISVVMYYMDHTLLLKADSDVWCSPSSGQRNNAGTCGSALKSVLGFLAGAAVVYAFSGGDAGAGGGKSWTAKGDPVAGYLEKYEMEHTNLLASKLTKGCTRHIGSFPDGTSQKMEIMLRFLEVHALRYTFVGESALAIGRFELLTSPWTNDINAGMMVDDAVSIFTMAKKKVNPAYVDASDEVTGKASFTHYCQQKIHKDACVGFRFFKVVGTPDCISFEALSWGFLQARFHMGCSTKSKKLFDVWLNYRCGKTGTKACKQGSKVFEKHVQKLAALKAGEKSDRGVLKEAIDMAGGKTEVVKLRSGLKVPVLVDNAKFLKLSFGKFWRDEVQVCPNYSEKCVNAHNKYKMREVLSSMAKIDQCERAMKR
jgi:solute carrier family 35 (UDP-sugar transporter), member A1/2/3